MAPESLKRIVHNETFENIHTIQKQSNALIRFSWSKIKNFSNTSEIQAGTILTVHSFKIYAQRQNVMQHAGSQSFSQVIRCNTKEKNKTAG